VRRSLLLVATVALLGSLCGIAFAQADYPSKPVKLMVGFAPGGGTDITARIVAKKLGELLGQQVIVDNRPGAGGNLATDLVAKAPPDGYTILLGNVGSLAVAPHMTKKLPYDPEKDLAPISLAVTFSNVVVVHPSLPAQTLADYVALAKAKPGTVNYGSSGIGGAGHLAGELFARMAGIEIVHVAYRGGAPALNDALAGQVLSLFASTPSVLPQVEAGKLRALATTGPQRAPLLPRVPTVAELGYPGYQAMNWYAFLAPARTPQAIIDRLSRDIGKALADPGILEQLATHGMQAIPSTPDALARYMASESATWGKVVKEAGITAD
jgi:tripartite-type tricarboxylate transporter receptor subunit TctC